MKGPNTTSDVQMNRYEAYDPETGEIVGVWRLEHTLENVKGFRDRWHPGASLRKITYTATVEEIP